MLIYLLKTDRHVFNPHMERNTKLAFVTEVKGLATALDAFCLSNFHNIKGKSVPIPKAVAVLKTIGEDLP